MWTTFFRKKPIFLIIFALFTAGILFFSLSANSRLQAFYRLTKNDPLFYDPFLEAEDLEKEIENAVKTETEFMDAHFKFLSEGEKRLYPKNWRLYPESFLRRLSEIQKSTASFLDTPSLWNTAVLLKDYYAAAAAYDRAASSHLKLLQNYLEENPESAETPIIYLLGSGTTLDIIKSDLFLIKKNAEALKNEAHKRTLCFLLGGCGRTNLDPRGDSPEEEFKNEVNISILDPQTTAPRENYSRVSGPYQIKSGCWGFTKTGKSPNHFFYLYTYERRSGMWLKPKLADRNYYLDYKKTVEFPPAELYLSYGMRFNFQPETNNYRCSDNTYWSLIMAMDYLKQDLLARGFVEIKEISAAEKNFVENSIVSEEDFYFLQNLYEKNYRNIKASAKPHEELLWKRMIFTRGKFYALPYILKDAARTLEIVGLENQHSESPAEIPYLFASHINYSIYFLPFSKTVWRIDEQPDYLLKRTFRLDSAFVTYQDLKKIGYGDGEIRAFHESSSRSVLEKTLEKSNDDPQ